MIYLKVCPVACTFHSIELIIWPRQGVTPIFIPHAYTDELASSASLFKFGQVKFPQQAGTFYHFQDHSFRLNLLIE